MITLDIETTGLYPSPPEGSLETEDFIVAIGVMDEFGMSIFTVPFEGFKTSLEAAEINILRTFSNWFFDNPIGQEEPILLTYNGFEFDIPFISTKLLKYSKDNPQFSACAKHLVDTRNIDLIRYAKFACGRRLGKEDACRKLANLYVPRKTEGLWNARIYKNPSLLTENDHVEMLQHNATDLAATARLHNVVSRFPDYDRWRMVEFRMETVESEEMKP